MIALFLLFVATFAPQLPSTPNRQPQLAVRGQEIALTYGAGNAIYFALSQDKGATWTTPLVVSSQGTLALGMRRGPRIAFAGASIVISAVVGNEGRGRDENLLVWRSEDHGKTWQRGDFVPGNEGGDESQLVELANGRILIDADALAARSG